MPSGPHRVPDAEFLALQAALAGRYSLEWELGRGAMGVVFRAREVRLDRPVAIKLLRPELAQRAEVRERFLREARTAAQLCHPNIVPIYLADEAGSLIYFVMACVEGETLAHRLERKGPYAPDEAARLLRSIAYALAYAHARGVVHRDIKPENILIERESRRPLVADFGIAQVARLDGTTLVGELVGTPQFMSPEQAAGDAVDLRTDIYSLGILGYYAVSGVLPFTGKDVRTILTRHITVEPAPLRSHRPDLPPRLVDTIHRCLAKDRDARFASAEALAQALDEALDRPSSAPLPIRTYLRRVRRPRIEILLVAGLTAALIVYLVQTILGKGPAVVEEALAAGAALGLGWLLLDELRETRELVRAGYGHAEVLRAVRAERDSARREVSASMDGALPDLATVRRIRAVFLLSCIALLAVLMGAAWLRRDLAPLDAVRHMSPALSWSFVAVSAVLLGSGARLAMARAPVFGDLGIRIWDSAVTRGGFTLAALGVTPRAMQPGDRPTEVAVGEGVLALLDSLDPSTAAGLVDVSELTPRLEAAATRLREQLRHHTSAELERRLRDVVAVLDDFRVGLLRLRMDNTDDAELRRAAERGTRVLQGEA